MRGRRGAGEVDVEAEVGLEALASARAEMNVKVQGDRIRNCAEAPVRKLRGRPEAEPGPRLWWRAALVFALSA